MSFVLFDHHTSTFVWRDRLRAALIHLGLSVLVAALAGLLVFVAWYPFPYRVISGGRALFLLVVSVDVVLGPLITFAIFDRSKPWKVLVRDLWVVAALQLAGLAYGLWTVQIARPVHMVFEFDRFRVVHRLDIPEQLEGRTPPGVALAPLTGPTVIAVRAFRSEQERLDTTLQALQGVPLSARPDLWEPYASARERVLQAAQPVAQLKSRFPQRTAAIDEALAKAGRQAAGTAYLPLVARKEQAWTVLLDGTTAEIVGYLPLDSF